MTANALLYTARHKIEMCDRIISKTIRKAGTAKILKTRVDIEKNYTTAIAL